MLTFLLGKPLLVLTLGKAFAAAAPVLTWQVAAVVLAMWAMPLEPMLISTGRPGASLRTRIVVSACYLLALAPMVRHFGVVGAGMASVAASVLLGVGMLIGVVQWRRDVRIGPAARQSQALP